jgi:DNA-binding MarR family transcriptional regulator
MAGRSLGEVAAAFVRRKGERVHRYSYDIDDERAKPWRRVGDGSRQQWSVFKNALLRTLREHIGQQRCEAKRGGCEEATRLLPRDILILEATLDFFNAGTGEFFPSQDTIAERTGWSRPAVNDSLQRLSDHGYLDWVRRSAKTDLRGDAGPQREQASNAYYFDWRGSMLKRTWSRFWQLVVAGLKRLGTAAPTPPAAKPSAPPGRHSPLREDLARLGRAVRGASQRADCILGGGI